MQVDPPTIIVNTSDLKDINKCPCAHCGEYQEFMNAIKREDDLAFMAELSLKGVNALDDA